MHLKRVAGIVNIIAAVVFIGIGVRKGNNAFMVIGGIFLLLGIIRLVQTRGGPPPA